MTTEPITLARVEELEAGRAYCEALSETPTLEQVLARDAHYRERDATYAALLAAARRLVELESALEFLAKDTDLFDLWNEDDGLYRAETPHGLHGVTAASPATALLHHCQQRGWTPPVNAERKGESK